MKPSGRWGRTPLKGGAGGLGLLLALVFLSAFGLFVFSYLPRQRAAEIERWGRDLAVRTDLRREALTRYFENDLGDAATLAGFPANAAALAPGAPEAATSHLRKVFEEFLRGEKEKHGIALFDASGAAVVSTAGLQPDAGCRAAARAAVASGAGAIGMHVHAGFGALVTFTAPVASTGGAPEGVIAMTADPRAWLFPFLTRPLAGAATGEAILVDPAGPDALVLSPIRAAPDALLSYRRPFGQLGFGVKAALEGSEAVVLRTDPRGVPVIAISRRLPPSPWLLAAKVDEAEALGEFHTDARRTALALGAFLLAASALVWGLAQRRERLVQAASAESESRYRALFDGMLNGIAHCEVLYEGETPSDFVYLDVNPAFTTLTGLTEVVGRKVSDVIPGIHTSNPELLAFYARVAGTGVPARLETWVEPLGVWFGVAAFSPRRGRFVAVFESLTEKKRAAEELLETQRQLGQAQRMEAIGRLAGGVAHDFNNLLTVIRGYAELLSADLEPGQRGGEELGEILRAAERAAGLTGQLLSFSRRQTFEMRPLDLGAVVSDTEKMLKRLIGEDIHLSVARPPHVGPVQADRGQLEQVLLNLAVNARDAMPEGGPLRLSLAETAVDAPLTSVDGGIPPGLYVVLSVSDAGCGMPPETLEHAFEPFFTTKETGKGTGLGLATVFGVVKQCRGHIRVASTPGHGTTFDLYFPRVDEEGAVPPPAAAEGRGGTETILVAEDEAAVRDLAVRMLTGQGYHVLPATGGEQALATAGAEGAIDLLLTDLVMPGMSGAELAQHLSVSRPGLRVLFMSGYPHDVLSQFRISGADVHLLRKPFTAADLTRRVRETLDRPAPAPGSAFGSPAGSHDGGLPP